MIEQVKNRVSRNQTLGKQLKSQEATGKTSRNKDKMATSIIYVYI